MELFLDLSDFLERYKNLADQINTKLNDAVAKLTYTTHAHMVEQAQQKLHSRRDIFLKNLPAPSQLDSSLWEIKLLKPAVWIEEGLKSSFDMLPGFLSSPKAKSGSQGKYLVIPFKHNKGPSKQTPAQQALTAVVKKELSKAGVSYGKLDKNPDGSPKAGRLFSTNINKPEQKNQTSAGKLGPQGRPWQANPKPPGQAGPGGRPFLHGLNVYQKEYKSAQGKVKVEKSILTFRTASAKHSGSKWIHPGLEPAGIFDDAIKYASEQWEKSIMPELFKELGINE